MERIDDLQYEGLKIIQNSDGFCFGIDSVLLSDFAKRIKSGSLIVDLGAGTGILSILLSKKVCNSKIIAFEKQKEVFYMACRSIEFNNLQDSIKMFCKDILDIDKSIKVDAVVTNPPYKKLDTGIYSSNVKKQISRFESTADLDDWIRISSMILKDFGEFYMVYRSERLAEVINIMNKYYIEPKEIRFVYSKITDQSTIVLIKGVKFGKRFLKIDKPLIIYDENGNYTSEIDLIYNRRNNG